MKFTLNPKIDSFLPYDVAILKARGVENVQGYLHPDKIHFLDPLLLDHMQLGCLLLRKHLDNIISRIAIIVDSDMDGICSAAMMYLWIKHFYPQKEITYFLHSGKQHGLEDMYENVEDYDLVIIPDAGSNDYEMHKLLKESGVDILILDHHEAEKYSEDAVVINNQLSEKYYNKSLCGAGVVLKFLWFYEHNYVSSTIFDDGGFADALYDLAAAAIVADVMSLRTTENRYIVSRGLSDIRNYGLKTFVEKQAFSLKGKLTPIGVGFYIAPIVNAIIRVGSDEDKDLLFRAFIRGAEVEPSTKRGHKPGDIEIVAEKAFRIGTNCRNKQNKLMDFGEKLILNEIAVQGADEYPIIFVDLPDEIADAIPSELTGLIAMRINNALGKPTLIGRDANDNRVKGSIRNNGKNGLDFKDFLIRSKCFDFVEGHANAAGFSIPYSQIQNFLDYCKTTLYGVDLTEPSYVVDYMFSMNDLYEIAILAEEVDHLSDIWGNDIEVPKIAVKDISINREDVKIMGANKDSVKIVIDDIEIVRFKDADFAEEIMSSPQMRLTAVGEVNMNDFGGKVSPQFIIRDYELADAKYDF